MVSQWIRTNNISRVRLNIFGFFLGFIWIHILIIIQCLNSLFNCHTRASSWILKKKPENCSVWDQCIRFLPESEKNHTPLKKVKKNLQPSLPYVNSNLKNSSRRAGLIIRSLYCLVWHYTHYHRGCCCRILNSTWTEISIIITGRPTHLQLRNYEVTISHLIFFR